MKAPPKPDDLFACDKLHATLLLRVCVARQAISASELAKRGTRPWSLRRHDDKRGRAPSFPYCVTECCLQGRQNLLALAQGVVAGVKHGTRSDLAEQSAARRALDAGPGGALLARGGRR